MQDFIKRNTRNAPTVSYFVGIAIAVAILGLIADIFAGVKGDQLGPIRYLMLPMHIDDAIYQPWSLLTWPFAAPFEGRLFFNIIFNLLFFYQFGRILHSLIGEAKIRNLLVFSVMTIGLITLGYMMLAHPNAADVVPKTPEESARLVHPGYLFGFTGLVGVVVAGAITVAPNYPIQMLLFGRVKILWVGLILLVLKAAWMINGADFVAIITGSIIGFGHIRLMRAGYDIPGMIIGPIMNAFRDSPKKPRMKVVKTSSQGRTVRTEEDELNRILDKINQVGYERLTQEEKEFLANFEDKKEQ